MAYRFPRNTSNLQTWLELMSDQVVVEGVLYLTCSEDAMMVRMSRADDIINQSPPQAQPYSVLASFHSVSHPREGKDKWKGR